MIPADETGESSGNICVRSSTPQTRRCIAISEELLAANEELFSNNEELAFTKLDLQPANEQLTSLKDELRARNACLAQLSGDLTSLLEGLEIPILVVHAGQRIRRVTPAARRLLNLANGDIDRPLHEVAFHLGILDWDHLFKEVADTPQVVEREMKDQNGHCHLLRIRLTPHPGTGSRVSSLR
ncbi:MAG TPA: PAS domain-containing protein [Bryobacteraceae bacterium]|nr:PAS domain-containing protein [Bryobacteraceae bacterium]